MTTETVTSGQAAYSAGEWETRVDLAAAYRIVDQYGMSDIANQAPYPMSSSRRSSRSMA